MTTLFTMASSTATREKLHSPADRGNAVFPSHLACVVGALSNTGRRQAICDMCRWAMCSQDSPAAAAAAAALYINGSTSNPPNQSKSAIPMVCVCKQEYIYQQCVLYLLVWSGRRTRNLTYRTNASVSAHLPRVCLVPPPFRRVAEGPAHPFAFDCELPSPPAAQHPL